MTLAEPNPNNPNHRCGFLDLSSELRNEIYELALIAPNKRATVMPSKVTSLGGYDFNGIPMHESIVDTNLIAPEPALLRVCRQTRQGGLPIYYGNNIFSCERKVVFIQWLEHLGTRKRTMLTELQGFTPWLFKWNPKLASSLPELPLKSPSCPG